MEEYVLKGNSAIVKCHIPSFVSDFVTVSAWILDETDEVYATTDYGNFYIQNIHPFSFYTFLILSRKSSLLYPASDSYFQLFMRDKKYCVLLLSSFFKSTLVVHKNIYNRFFKSISVVTQSYAVNVHEEYVLKGNAVVLKCVIPSFVADFVDVVAWIVDDDEEYSSRNDNYGILKLFPRNLSSHP